MPNVQLAGNGFGGYIQGNYGNYSIGVDGTFTVDTRDAPALLALGMSYTKMVSNSFTFPIVPPAAAIGAIVASGALSNGVVAVTAQPTVTRPVNVEVGTGTTAITAGTVAVTYRGNDGVVATDTFPLACALSSATTQGLSRGVVSISSIVVAVLVGGTSPWLRLSTTAALSLPVDPNTVDFAVNREYDAGATIAVGTLGVSMGSIFPTTPPNGTATYSFGYTYTAPTT